MLQRITYSLLLCTLVTLLHAQTQDFVLTQKGDTLRGKIKIESIDNNHRVIVAGVNKKRISLTVVQTKVVYLDGVKYEPVLYNDRYIFMKLLQEGYLSLYGFQVEKQYSYDGRYLLKKDKQGMELPNLAFKRGLIKFLAECPNVTSQIESGKLGRNELTQIINEFNACISANSVMHTTDTKSIPTVVNATKLEPWIALEEKINTTMPENKTDVLEMISEVKSKIAKGEKIPKFLMDGLRSALQSSSELVALFEKAIANM
jgi:hypothetical protein